MDNIYEENSLLAQYLLFHYGDDALNMPYSFGPLESLNFPTKVLHENLNMGSLYKKKSALDIGCAVGRTSFELSLYFEKVTSIDFSSNFIRTANQLKKGITVPYSILIEGENYLNALATHPKLSNPKRISFQQGDATNLPQNLGSFDFVIAANLICRLSKPELFLKRLPTLVNPGGTLLISTPFTWLEDYTPKKRWLSKNQNNGFSVIKEQLQSFFTLTQTKDISFIIREHSRKFQWSVAQCSVWKRFETQ